MREREWERVASGIGAWCLCACSVSAGLCDKDLIQVWSFSEVSGGCSSLFDGLIHFLRNTLAKGSNFSDCWIVGRRVTASNLHRSMYKQRNKRTKKNTATPFPPSPPVRSSYTRTFVQPELMMIFFRGPCCAQDPTLWTSSM